MSTVADFGRYLRQQRELRGLSLDDVARNTKIPPTLVQALEDGQAERFPERVFVINYVRSYAVVVGLSPDDVANRFDELAEVPRQTQADPAVAERARRERAVTMAWVMAAAALTLVVVLWWFNAASAVTRFTHR